MLLELKADGENPRALINRPVLIDRWKYPVEVFNQLTGSRRYTSNGAANIPISEFSHYAAGYGFTSEEWTSTWEDLTIVDNVWLSEVAKRAKSKTSKE